MGFSESGANLLYGYEIARVAESGSAAGFVSFPNSPISLSWSDRQAFAEHSNLAGDARRTYLKVLAPDAMAEFDPLDEGQLAFWRSIHLHPSDFYILRIKRTERILAQDCIVYGAGANRKVVVPHSSYTQASKRVVAAGGASLLSNVSAKVLWTDAIQERLTAPHVNVAGVYDDATEILSLLNVLDTPTAGNRVYVSFSSSAWIVKMKPSPGWSPVPARSDLHRMALTFEAV